MNELVLEVGQPESPQLSTRIVKRSALKHALEGVRPRYLLAYTAKASSRALDVRLNVLRNWRKPKATLDFASSHVIVVSLSEIDWQKQVERSVSSLREADILCFVGGAETRVQAKAQQDEDPLAAARARRDQVLTLGKWYTAAEVSELVNGRVAKTNPSQYASMLRQKRRLLGVRQNGEYLHPGFQFNYETGTLRPETAKLLKILPKDETGWAAALWCFQPTGRLQGHRPADMFADDPKAVVAAAKKDFQGDTGNW
jgi:hypothetical protein